MITNAIRSAAYSAAGSFAGRVRSTNAVVL
jgi:hypothetical protein